MSRRSYVRHEGAEPARSTLPRCTLRSVGRFEGDTAYRLEYTGRGVERARPKPARARVEPGAFNGNTAYRDDYADHAMPKPRVVGAGFKYLPPEAPFSGGSDYRDNYRARTARVACPIVVPCDNKRLLY